MSAKDSSDPENKVVAEPSANSPPLSELPEGGLQAWLTVAGGFIILFCTFGSLQSFGVYQDYYTRIALNERPPSDSSWIGSLQSWGLFSVGLVSGKLFDDGYFRALLATGSLLYVFSSFMLSLAHPHHFYQYMLAQGVGKGLATGILFLPSVSVTAHYFRRRRGIAMGIVLSGSTFAAMLYPIVLNNLFASTGFGWGVRAAAFIDAFLLSVAFLSMKTRLPPRNKMPGARPVDLHGIFRDWPYWIAVIGMSFVWWGILIPFFYIQLFAVKHGIPENLSKYCITVLNAAGLFGRLIPMFLSDTFGQFNVIIPVSVVAGCLVFAFLGATSSGGLVAFLILYGFFSGGFVALCAAVAASFSRDVGEVGTRLGLACFTISFFVLTGNPLAGALLNASSYTWANPIIFSGVTVLAGTGIMLVSRIIRAKRIGTQRL